MSSCITVLVMPDTKTTIPLTRRGEFMWLDPHNRDHVDFPVDGATSSTVYAPGGRNTAPASLIDWHEAMGHPHPASILFLEQRGLIGVNGEKSIDDFNLAGPFTPDMDGYTYLMVFIDEATRFKSACGLKTKDQAYTNLKPYINDMQLQGTNIVTIRGDGAGEFGRSSSFREELKKLGLKWESTPPYTHQQQGLVERAIRQIVEGGRAQLARASLGDEFWTWACKTLYSNPTAFPAKHWEETHRLRGSIQGENRGSRPSGNLGRQHMFTSTKRGKACFLEELEIR